MFFQRNRCKTVSKKGWHTELSLSQSDGRTKPGHHLPKSPFFARCCGQMLEAKPQTDGTPYSCFKIHFVRKYRNLLKNRTKADLRQRDLSTGVTVAHGRFFRLLWR